MNHLQIGQDAESLACQALEKAGLALKEKNFQAKPGEIDLIMQDEPHLVFVEVRYRKNDSHGDGAATVSRNKQLKIIKTATIYLLEHQLYDKIPCRFDVVSISQNADGFQLDWIKDAFQ